METTKKLFIGALCVFLCMLVYVQLKHVRGSLQQAHMDTLARLYADASPHALVTPAVFRARSLPANSAHEAWGANAGPAAVLADTRLVPYLQLHNSRFENLP